MKAWRACEIDYPLFRKTNAFYHNLSRQENVKRNHHRFSLARTPWDNEWTEEEFHEIWVLFMFAESVLTSLLGAYKEDQVDPALLKYPNGAPRHLVGGEMCSHSSLAEVPKTPTAAGKTKK